MFEIVEGAVPAGERGRIDLFVKRDESTGKVVATWDRSWVSAKASHRVHRVETLGQDVNDVYLEALAAAREADVPLCIMDGNHHFPKSSRPTPEHDSEA